MPVREGVRSDPQAQTVAADLCRCGCLVCECGVCPDCHGHEPTCPKASGVGVFGSSR